MDFNAQSLAKSRRNSFENSTSRGTSNNEGRSVQCMASLFVFLSLPEQNRSACCTSGELSASYVMVIIATQLR